MTTGRRHLLLKLTQKPVSSMHGQVALEQGEQNPIPNGPERVEVQIAPRVMAGMLQAGVAALMALRLDVLGLQLLLLLREAAAGRGGVRHHRVAEARVETAAANASSRGSWSGSTSGSMVLAAHLCWGNSLCSSLASVASSLSIQGFALRRDSE